MLDWKPTILISESFITVFSFICFQKEELFKAADENGDGVVSMDELAMLLAVQQEK